MGLAEQRIQINGRPVMLASFVNEDIKAHKIPMREAFPAADTTYMGGESDGDMYQSTFAGGSLEDSYRMITAFLEEEGYEGLPLPKDVEELKHFQLNTRNRQVLMFEDNGYVHNPIKILFPLDRRKKSTLILCVYNEEAENHLLRFHNKI
ncbi:MAG: hypothetical protein AAGJ93_03555 [Bacteroidota bacterium]